MSEDNTSGLPDELVRRIGTAFVAAAYSAGLNISVSSKTQTGEVLAHSEGTEDEDTPVRCIINF
jgi:hypothetical protein